MLSTGWGRQAQKGALKFPLDFLNFPCSAVQSVHYYHRDPKGPSCLLTVYARLASTMSFFLCFVYASATEYGVMGAPLSAPGFCFRALVVHPSIAVPYRPICHLHSNIIVDLIPSARARPPAQLAEHVWWWSPWCHLATPATKRTPQQYESDGQRTCGLAKHAQIPRRERSQEPPPIDFTHYIDIQTVTARAIACKKSQSLVPRLSLHNGRRSSADGDSQELP